MPTRPFRASRGCLREEDEKDRRSAGFGKPLREPIHACDQSRPPRIEGKSRPHAPIEATLQPDALLLATIKAVGVVQPPVIAPEPSGGNGHIINAGHRQVRQAIAAGLEETEALVDEAATTTAPYARWSKTSPASH